MNRAQIMLELFIGCHREQLRDHLAISWAIENGEDKATILAMPECDAWPETYVWLRDNLDA